MSLKYVPGVVIFNTRKFNLIQKPSKAYLINLNLTAERPLYDEWLDTSVIGWCFISFISWFI